MASKGAMIEVAYQLFDSYDTNDSGFLEPAEFKKVMTEVFHEVNKQFSCDQAHLNKLFTICDGNDDSKLSRKEFGKAVELFLEPIYIKVE